MSRAASPRMRTQQGANRIRSARTAKSPTRRLSGGLVLALTTLQACAASLSLSPAQPNEIVFDSQAAKFVRVVLRNSQGEPCLDELEV